MMSISFSGNEILISPFSLSQSVGVMCISDSKSSILVLISVTQLFPSVIIKLTVFSESEWVDVIRIIIL